MQVGDYFERQPYETEIIVVDDGSLDNTARLVQHYFPAVRVISYPANRGKGYAVKTGMLAAGGEIRLYYDADGSTPITEIDRIWQLLDGGADIVIGSRSLPDSHVELRQNPMREFMGRTFNRIVRLILGEPFIDTQCGFKAFTADAAQKVFTLQTLDRFCFDTELLYIARKKSLRVAELPVRWLNCPGSSVAIVGDSAQMLKHLFKIRLNAVRGKYRG
jgi:glycosyltransferase involved in cell wall biosynthesis